MRDPYQLVRTLALALALATTACERADYSGASFPPAEGPAKPTSLLLYVFEAEGKGVPWGDAAFYHRESPAELGAVPVAFEASLDGEPFQRSGEQGDFAARLTQGRHGLRVVVADREVLRPVRAGKDQSLIHLWALEPGAHLLGISGVYPRTELTSWPVDELAETLRSFRVFVEGLRQALSRGAVGDLERLLTDDFRDADGTRTDFARAAATRAAQGNAWSLIGDAWLRVEGEDLKAELVLAKDGGRTFPTVDLVRDERGPGGLRARTFY